MGLKKPDRCEPLSSSLRGQGAHIVRTFDPLQRSGYPFLRWHCFAIPPRAASARHPSPLTGRAPGRSDFPAWTNRIGRSSLAPIPRRRAGPSADRRGPCQRSLLRVLPSRPPSSRTGPEITSRVGRLDQEVELYTPLAGHLRRGPDAPGCLVGLAPRSPPAGRGRVRKEPERAQVQSQIFNVILLILLKETYSASIPSSGRSPNQLTQGKT